MPLLTTTLPFTASAFISGGLFGYLLRSIRPIAILTSMITGAALGSLVTYEYLDSEPNDHRAHDPRAHAGQYNPYVH